LALAQRDPRGALELIEAVTRSRVGTSPRLEWFRCTALLSLRRYQEVCAELPALLAAVQAKGLIPLAWRLHALHSAALRMAGRRAAADLALAEGRAIVERIAAGLPDDLPRQTFQDSALVYLAQPLGEESSDTALSVPGGLTMREAEVAALIARGLSNAEIAAALFVTKRTVETHISSIRAKLGTASRTHIALWAAGAGLPNPPFEASDEGSR
jgi:DNA-binding CsgD family transcriptional regulator